MHYLTQLLWILGFTAAGEVLHALLPLPVPAAVYGLLLLFLALETGRLPLAAVQDTGRFLLGLMPVLFIPPAVNLVESWPLLADAWGAVLAILVLSTLAVFAVSGRVTQCLLPRSDTKPDAEEGPVVHD